MTTTKSPIVFDEQRAATYDERIQFFQKIAARLQPQAILVSADLTADMTTATYKNMLPLFARMLSYAGFPAEEIAKM
jgi:hypothetical protein